MTLTVGSRVGQFEIAEAIGSGGMGEVFRARDRSLGRDVAIKVLPQEFSHDPERRHLGPRDGDGRGLDSRDAIHPPGGCSGRPAQYLPS